MCRYRHVNISTSALFRCGCVFCIVPSPPLRMAAVVWAACPDMSDSARSSFRTGFIFPLLLALFVSKGTAMRQSRVLASYGSSVLTQASNMGHWPPSCSAFVCLLAFDSSLLFLNHEDGRHPRSFSVLSPFLSSSLLHTQTQEREKHLYHSVIAFTQFLYSVYSSYISEAISLSCSPTPA